MSFKEEVVVSGVNMKRVHVIFRREKIVNVGTANMTDRQADAKIKKTIGGLKAELTKEILAELTPKKEQEKRPVVPSRPR